MLNPSFSSLESKLTESENGCQWDEKSGFLALDEAVTTNSRIVLISQLFSEFLLGQVLIALRPCVDIKTVKLNPNNRLSSSMAVDLLFHSDSVGDETLLRQRIAQIADMHGVDLVIQQHAPSLNRPGLLVMDMDSTMIQIECIDEIARLAGRYEEVAAVTAKAMNGKLAFADSLKTRVACLTGVEESALATIKAQMPLMPGLWPLVKTLKQHNWRIAIASGGFTYFADYLKDWLELDAAVSNTLEFNNGALTGNTVGKIIDANIKATTLVELCEKWGIDSTQTVAMGDGANDLLMLESAELGIAFHAKPSVREQANHSIQFQALDALLLLLQP